MANFNPNELILERVRAVEEYDTQTNELRGRYTQVEDPSLQTSADGTDVTDAMGAPIATFYQNQQGTFSFSNSLFSLDLAATQFGTTKTIATAEAKIRIPVSETLAIVGNKVTLSYVPVGTTGSEVTSIRVINSNNTFGTTYTLGSTATGNTFTIDAAKKTITMPSEASGKVFVNYTRETENAVSVEKRTDSVPAIVKLLIHAIFHDPCDANIKYAGVIVCERAQVDPSSVELNLTMDGKHAATYKLSKPYCDDQASLFDILVAED